LPDRLSILNQKELFVIITLKTMTTGIAGGFGGQEIGAQYLMRNIVHHVYCHKFITCL
jgi:hypothetical protein